jgi:DNA-binding CsgD family transcriptional regulator
MPEDIGLGFLPFLSKEKPLINSVGLLEILSVIESEADVKGAIDALQSSIFGDLAVENIALVAPANSHLYEGDWVVWHQSKSDSQAQGGVSLELDAKHALRGLAKRGLVVRSTTSGHIVNNDPSEYSGNHGEKLELICIPLFYNLEAQGALMIVCQRTKELYDLDPALLSGVQAIFSHFFFKFRPDTQRQVLLTEKYENDYSEYGFTEIEERIARAFLADKTDLQITRKLTISQEELNQKCKIMAGKLSVQSRDEIIEELIALRFK